jgi:hypothetical protein
MRGRCIDVVFSARVNVVGRNVGDLRRQLQDSQRPKNRPRLKGVLAG